jgi:hypothetical protein
MQAAVMRVAAPQRPRTVHGASRAAAAGGLRLRASPLALPVACRPRRAAVALGVRAAAAAAGSGAGSPPESDPFKARARRSARTALNAVQAQSAGRLPRRGGRCLGRKKRKP